MPVGIYKRKPRKLKTHCLRGHEFTPENTYIQLKGKLKFRHCRKCHRINAVYDQDYHKEYFKRNNLRYAIASKKWVSKNPEKGKSHQTVHKAIMSGRLFKKPCEVCGKEKVDAHHEDYSKPLEVMWLCRKHHKERHLKFNN